MRDVCASSAQQPFKYDFFFYHETTELSGLKPEIVMHTFLSYSFLFVFIE